jgi:hypothetical protein
MTPFAGLLIGIIFTAVGVPLYMRLVPPNSLYGLRVGATAVDESVWYEANHRTGRDFVLLGMALLAMSAWLWQSAGLWAATEGRWLIGVEISGVLGIAAKGVFVANRLARQRSCS